MLRDKFKRPAVTERENTGREEQRAGKENWQEILPQVPDGMFRKCGSCKKILYEKDVRDNWYCCPKCGTGFRIDPLTRIRMTADVHSFQEWDADLCGGNPLDFPEYEEKLEQLRAKTGLADAVLTGTAAIRGIPVAIGAMSADFLMGSMGWAVGERLTRLIERAETEALPVILFCCSGGARMQEGIVSLMQMAKVSQALQRYSKHGGLYIPVLTDPTMGGVTASFAMLGDVILAEPGAMIGFAGARVIRQTIGQKLPDGFQSAEFLQKHGFIDRIVKRESDERNTFVSAAKQWMKCADERKNRSEQQECLRRHRKQEVLWHSQRKQENAHRRFQLGIGYRQRAA